MKRTQRAIAFLMAILISLSCVPLSGLGVRASAATVVDTGYCGTNVIYKLDSDGLLTISGNGAIDDVANFRDVMFQDSPTPWDKDEVKRVVIKDGVTRIGAYLFSDHYELYDVQIADSVTSIGKGAFQYCSSLVSLVLPEGITSIPEGMCALSDLRYVYIPDSITEINPVAFHHTLLIEVEYGGTKEKWDNITIGDTNDILSDVYIAYDGGSSLTKNQSGTCGDNVTWSLTTDGTLKISGNGHMDSYIKGTVNGSYAKNGEGMDHPWFEYRSRIKKIIITSGVESVGAYAFYDCFNCTSLEIQNGVKTIKDGAFAYMPISSVVVPDSVSSLGEYAFHHCSVLKQVTLSDNITVIEDRQFQYCRNIKSIELPKNLTRIEYSGFYGCSFEELTIPASVTYIGDNFPDVGTVNFLGAVPDFSFNEPPANLLQTDYWYCLPEYYEAYKAVYEKWRAKCVLSDGTICAKLNKTRITLSADDPTCQLTVTDEKGNATSMTKNWWVKNSKVASVDQNGLVTASGHGETMLFVEISANGCRSIASCSVSTKRNDLMVALLPKDIEADFPVTFGTRMTSNGEVVGYQAGKLAETDTSNKYYQELLSLTNTLTADCSNDEQKARAIFKWVSTNVSYGGAIGIGNNAGQAYAVYLERKAHCEGFSKLTGFMLYLAGIPSCLVANAGHMWNIALLDGKWIMIDSTNDLFGIDYNEYGAIEWIGFGVDDLCFVIDSTAGVKLAGAGNHYLPEEREIYTSFVVPDFVDIIFGSTFDYCSNLESITLPKSIQTINKNAFEDSEKLKNVYYAGSESDWKSITIEEGNENLTNANITYNCTVKSVKVKTMPTKTTYYVGESFDSSGLTLTATHLDGSTETITSGFTCTGFDSETAGTKRITVNYGIVTVDFDVTVKEKPHSHSYTSSVTTPATCTEKGIKTYTCSCGASYTESISATGHKPGNWETASLATCTEAGESVKKCTVCGEVTQTVAIPATGHKPGEWQIVVEPTTEQEGFKVRECTTCGKVVEESTMPKYVEPEIDDVVVTTPSQTTINYGDSIVLHVDADRIPEGGYVKWSASNDNFRISASEDGTTCTITSAVSGSTVITATIFDADDNAVSKDEQEMTSKAGFWQKLISFFKNLFGSSRIIPQ